MSEPFESDPDHGSPSRALCAVHPETPAVSSCSRCGNFMCAACTGGPDASDCPACRAHAGQADFPFTRDGWTFSGVWEYSSNVFKQQWVMLSLGAVLYGVVYFSASMVGPFLGGMLSALAPDSAEVMVVVTGVVFGIASMILQLGMTMGMARLSIDAIEGRQVDLMRIFSQFGRVPHALLAMLVFGLGLGVAAGVGVLICVGLAQIEMWLGIISGLVLAAVLVAFLIPSYLLTTALVVSPEVDGFRILRQVWDNASGHRATIFGIMLLSGLLMMGGMMLCGLGFFPALAFSQVLYAVVYMALSRYA